MINHQQAIKNVISKRMKRGASEKEILAYLNGLLGTWKNNIEMKMYIESKIEKVGN